MARKEPAAARAVRLINNLTHTGDYAGRPFTLRPWQERRIVRPLFSTGTDGLRRYRTCLLMLPRKNGKTELAAAIAIYSLLFDGQTGGEIYLAAADREQAGKVFGAIVAMLRADLELEAEVEIIESQKRVVHRRSGSFAKAISAEAYSKHGFNASTIIYDELHAAPNRELWDVLATSQGARLQPLLIAISTAGYDRHSILYELYAHAKRVEADPTIDPTFLPVIFEAAVDADWKNEQVWKAANPALGDFRSLEDMRILAKRAQEIPAQENTFRRLYLNQWTEQAARWITLDAWDACRVDATPDYHRPCFVGLDLSTTTDLTALVGVYPGGDGFDVRACAFMPDAKIRERSLRERVPYDEWVRRGWLVATPGTVVDYERVRQTLQAWDAEGSVQEVAFDPWNATPLVTTLQEQDGFTCIPIRQGFANLSAPTKSLEKAILARTLRHDGHPVLRYCVGNVAIEQDAAGNVKPSKKLSTERIDLVTALVNAIDRFDRRSTAPAPSYSIYVFGGTS
jgi:phage terminase large subunit-like protein